MGLFSWIGDIFDGDDDEQPQRQVPAAPVYKSAEQLWQEAMGWGKANFPRAFGARESALTDLSRGNEFYQSFQPTSFEDALANDYFSRAKQGINQGLSMTGMEYSPILSEQYGKVGANIGEYLSNLGQTRALYSLASRLGIDPIALIRPFMGTDESQSNLQTGANYDNALLKSDVDFQNALQAYQNKGAGISSLFGLGGAALGAILGGPAGIGLGSSIGNMVSPIFGGSGTGGVGLGDALSLYGYLSPTGKTSKVKGINPASYSDLGAILGNTGAYPQMDFSQQSFNIPQGFDFRQTFNPATSWQNQFKMY